MVEIDLDNFKPHCTQNCVISGKIAFLSSFKNIFREGQHQQACTGASQIILDYLQAITPKYAQNTRKIWYFLRKIFL